MELFIMLLIVVIALIGLSVGIVILKAVFDMISFIFSNLGYVIFFVILVALVLKT